MAKVHQVTGRCHWQEATAATCLHPASGEHDVTRSKRRHLGEQMLKASKLQRQQCFLNMSIHHPTVMSGLTVTCDVHHEAMWLELHFNFTRALNSCKRAS